MNPLAPRYRSATLAPNLWQLTELGLFNCFLARSGDDLTLIDTGRPGGAPSILAVAARIGAPITRVLLTHVHQDHAGSLDALATALPDAGLLAPERELPFLGGDLSLRPGEGESPVRGAWVRAKARPTGFQPGETVGEFTVLPSPGHTPGHVSFLHEPSGALIAGDALQSLGGLAVAGRSRAAWFPFMRWGTWRPDLALESARMLAALRPKLVACGHGPAVHDPRTALRAAIEDAERAQRGRVAPGAI